MTMIYAFSYFLKGYFEKIFIHENTQEEPGESLSDVDKDEEDENMEEGCSKGEDDEESEDGFFVPDGYLSENEVLPLSCLYYQ